MAIEILDGILTPAQPRVTKRGFGRFENIRIQTEDGNWREFAKVATGPAMTSQIIKGGMGRYYLSTAGDPFALFGVRRPDGSSVYAHHTNLKPILLVISLLCTGGTIARFGFGIEVPLFGAVLGPPMLLGCFYFNRKKQAARRVFVEDNK